MARSGQAFPSPIGLYVHARAGLWISYRGAVALPGRLELPQPSAPPCPACAGHPCASACPVGALSTGAPYDVARCQSYLRTEAGRLGYDLAVIDTSPANGRLERCVLLGCDEVVPVLSPDSGRSSLSLATSVE